MNQEPIIIDESTKIGNSQLNNDSKDIATMNENDNVEFPEDILEYENDDYVKETSDNDIIDTNLEEQYIQEEGGEPIKKTDKIEILDEEIDGEITENNENIENRFIASEEMNQLREQVSDMEENYDLIAENNETGAQSIDSKASNESKSKEAREYQTTNDKGFDFEDDRLRDSEELDHIRDEIPLDNVEEDREKQNKIEDHDVVDKRDSIAEETNEIRAEISNEVNSEANNRNEIEDNLSNRNEEEYDHDSGERKDERSMSSVILNKSINSEGIMFNNQGTEDDIIDNSVKDQSILDQKIDETTKEHSVDEQLQIPIYLIYARSKFLLFPFDHISANPVIFDDISDIYISLEELFATLRSSKYDLNLQMSDEIVLSIPQLGKCQITEDNVYCKDLTISDFMNLFKRLCKCTKDKEKIPNYMTFELSTQPRFITRFNSIVENLENNGGFESIEQYENKKRKLSE